MRRTIAPEERYCIEHDDMYRLLYELPGQHAMRSVLRSVLEKDGKYAGPDKVLYCVHPEFDLGPCGPRKEPARIDMIVEVRTPEMHRENRRGLNIAFEVKTTDRDLLRNDRDNLRAKYVYSGQADSYWLLSSTDDIALKACCRYAGEPDVGVVCMASGKVMKIPERVGMTDKGKFLYEREILRRARSRDDDYYSRYYGKDNILVELEMR